MKFINVLCVTFVGLQLLSCSSTKKIESESNTSIQSTYIKNIIIDGKADEWQGVPLNFSPRSTFQYAIANNSSNLFIYLRVPNQFEQAKLLQGGMEVYLNSGEKKNKTISVTYPVKGELADVEKPIAVPGEKPDIKSYRLRMAGQLISMGRAGFKPEFNGVQSIHQNTGFKAALSWDENDVLIYELTIPLNAFTNDININDLAIGLYLNGLDRPKNDSPTASNFSSGDIGGRMGGGRQGTNFGNGGNRGQRHAENSAYNQREKLFVSESFWSQYKLNNVKAL